MKKAFLVFCTISSFITLSAQDSTLLSIGNYKVEGSTFERAFNKNRGLNLQGGQNIGEYFTLYQKFRLKVAAALDAGMDTVTSFKKELKSYRDQLASSYLTDNSLYDSILNESYYRTANEVKVAHIMIRFDNKSKSDDTLAAYEKIMAVYKRLENGEIFENVAIETSEDQSVKSNKGMIGYVTAFRFPYSFESACFNTAVGHYSKPFRTSFGYHIVKIYDKRPSRGEVKVAHIMVIVPQGSNEDKWNESKSKIESIAARIQKGEDFGALAKEVSDDKNSGHNNGELPWFGSGRMVPEFEEAAFSLKTIGEVSPIVRTRYGWRIIKLLDKRKLLSFNEMKADLKKKIQKNERGTLPQEMFIQKLKFQDSYRDFSANLKCFVSTDSSIYKGNYDFIPPVCNDLPLFSIQQETFSVRDFTKYLKNHKVPDKRMNENDFIKVTFAEFVKSKILNYENKNLESKYKDFRDLTEEYHDGILLFNIMDKEVWSKASHDTAGLKNYFEQNKSGYNWGERLEACVYKFSDSQIADKAFNIMKNNKKIKPAELKKLICDSTVRTACLQTESKLFSKGDNPIIDTIRWKRGISKMIQRNGNTYFVVVNEKISPEPKKFDDVKGLVIAGYQNVLEERWMTELNKHYKVIVNQELLHKIAEKYNSIKK